MSLGRALLGTKCVARRSPIWYPRPNLALIDTQVSFTRLLSCSKPSLQLRPSSKTVLCAVATAVTGVTRAVFSSSVGREVATAADKKIASDETKLSVEQEWDEGGSESRGQRFHLRYCLVFLQLTWYHNLGFRFQNSSLECILSNFQDKSCIQKCCDKNSNNVVFDIFASKGWYFESFLGDKCAAYKNRLTLIEANLTPTESGLTLVRLTNTLSGQPHTYSDQPHIFTFTFI